MELGERCNTTMAVLDYLREEEGVCAQVNLNRRRI